MTSAAEIQSTTPRVNKARQFVLTLRKLELKLVASDLFFLFTLSLYMMLHIGPGRSFSSIFASEMKEAMGARQGLTMDSLNFPMGPPCPIFLCPASRLPLKQLYGSLRYVPPTRRVAWGCLSLWTPHAAPYAYGCSGTANKKKRGFVYKNS
jgi:hypothetical protein